MKVDNRQEMAERFRLYGEIFMLCVDWVREEAVYDLSLDFDEMMEGRDYDYFLAETDEGDMNPCDGIHFEDGLLWVDSGIVSSPFLDVMSDTLQKIVELLERYKEADV